MKNIMIATASAMMIGLIITMFFYQHHRNMIVTPPGINTSQQEQRKEPEQTLFAGETIDYSLQNDELNITFDRGDNWTQVPVEKDKLFGGDYNGDEQELIADSYVLTKDRAAFLYVDGEAGKEKLILIYSLNQGKTWQDTVVTDSYPSIRFRKVAFLNDDFGYSIMSGDRTMSQEGTSVFLTHDGGENWENTNTPDTTRMIADGGFTDEKTGFLSFGTINPEAPDLYATQDAGESWKQASVNVPEKYKKVFVNAETPVTEDDHLAILLNQGPNGDYQGGEVKGKFISKDNGKTWEFSEEVEANETNK